MRKVEECKFTKEFDGLTVVGSCSLLGFFICPQVVSLVHVSNRRREHPMWPLPHPFVPRGIFASLSAIGEILRISAWAEVASSVIQSVVIFVVSYFLSSKKSVHIHDLSPDQCIRIDAIPAHSHRRPLVWHYSRFIGCIDDALQFLTERNDFDRIVLRLFVRMFAHTLAPILFATEMVQRSAALLKCNKQQAFAT